MKARRVSGYNSADHESNEGRVQPTFSGASVLRSVVLVSVLVASSRCGGGLERARQAGDEASAIVSLRVILSAQAVFSAGCGAGGYAPSLKVLATPAKQGGEGFISPDLGSDPAVKSRYVISMTPGLVASELPESCNGLAAGRTTRSFFVTAVPAQEGGRFFATNAEATIYERPCRFLSHCRDLRRPQPWNSSSQTSGGLGRGRAGDSLSRIDSADPRVAPL